MIWPKLDKRRAAGAWAALAASCSTISDDHPQLGAPQDVEFLRGCWVMKKEPGGEVLAFLRLLPPSLDATTYEGEVQIVSGDVAKAGTRFAFARDGSSVVRTSTRQTNLFASGKYVSAPGPVFTPPPDFTPPQTVNFVHSASPGTVLTIDHHAWPDRSENVLIRVRNADTDAISPPIQTDFDGERDGCD